MSVWNGTVGVCTLVCLYLSVCLSIYMYRCNGVGDKSMSVWNGTVGVCTLVYLYLSVCLSDHLPVLLP